MAWYHEFTIPFCKEGTRELDIEKTTIIVVLLIATIITFIIVREKYYERTSERKNHLRYALALRQEAITTLEVHEKILTIVLVIIKKSTMVAAVLFGQILVYQFRAAGFT